MKPFKHKLVAAALLSVLSNQAFAECDSPPAPIIPDGNVASMDELVSAQKAIKMYQASLGEYRECLKALEETVSTGDDAQEKTTEIMNLYNSSVDDEAAVAEEFNSAVQVFKTR